jgi:two-component system, OmpR family, response regulator VicR
MNHSLKSISILYVEDDEAIAYLTKDSLMLKGYDVELATDGSSAYDLFLKRKFQICIVDIMLPVMDGWTLAKKIREVDAHIPILFLSAKSQVDDKIRGLSIGADDYITKPFSMEELALRIEVFLKRSNMQEAPADDIIKIGDTFINLSSQFISHEGRKKKLTQRECELLDYLIRNANRVVKRDEILNAIWGKDDYFLGRSLDVFISRLRKILADEPSIQIENVHGVGFRFIIRQ